MMAVKRPGPWVLRARKLKEAYDENGATKFSEERHSRSCRTTLLPSIFDNNAVAKDGKPKEKSKIVARTLGKTGIELPIVSMGVMNADNPNLVKVALDSGIVHLDTAQDIARIQNVPDDFIT